MYDEKLDLLSEYKDFAQMEGKFVVKKTDDICPRIADLKKKLGFAPDEGLNAHNMYRLIPNARYMHRILGKRHSVATPTGNVSARQVAQAVRFPAFNNRRFFELQKQNFQPYKRVPHYMPPAKRFRNSMGNGCVSYPSTNFDASTSNMYFPTSRTNRSFDASDLNTNSYRSNYRNVPNPRNNFIAPTVNNFGTMVNFDARNLRRPVNISSVTDYYSEPFQNRDLNVRSSRQQSYDLQLKRDFSVNIYNGPAALSNSNVNFDAFNSNRCLPVSDLNRSFDVSNSTNQYKEPFSSRDLNVSSSRQEFYDSQLKRDFTINIYNGGVPVSNSNEFEF